MHKPMRNVYRWFSVFLMIAGCGGGGGGGSSGSSNGGGGSTDTTPPTISSTSPIDNVTGVAVDAAIRVTFSEPMNPATITPTTFTVNAGLTAVPGTVSYSGTIATFTPTDDLTYFTSYTATVTTGAKDLAGNALSNIYIWNFNTTAASVVSSLDKISAAEAAGTIDHDTALLYSLYVVFDPTSLPAEYRGDDSNVMVEGSTEILELVSRFDQLSADLQAKVRPFLLRPDDPESLWNKRLNEIGTSSSSPVMRAAGVPPPPWNWIDTVITPIRLWYPKNLTVVTENGPMVFKDIAETLAKEIDSSAMWEKEKSAMLGTKPCGDNVAGGGVDRLDVYLLPPGVGLNWDGRVKDPLGEKLAGIASQGEFRPGCGYPSFILLNGTLPFDELKNTMAHELFHAFQFGCLVKGEQPESNWWIESTATWAEDLVYPTLNMEQGRLRKKNNHWSYEINRGFIGPLDYWERGSIAPYAAYIWPFYLSHRAGGSPTKIGELWQQSASMSPLNAMANLPDWPEAYKSFALWNWNKEPAELYYEIGGEKIVDLGQYTDYKSLMPDKGPGAYGSNIVLPGTTMSYIEMTHPAESVKRLDFDLIAFANTPGWGLQAIITIFRNERFEDYIEDWSSRTKRTFCLKQEPVTKVILVASNSNISGQISADLKLNALSSECFGGTITYSRTGSKTLDTSGPTPDGQKTETTTGIVNEKWTFEIDPDGKVFNFPWPSWDGARRLLMEAKATVVATETYVFKSQGNEDCVGEGGVEANGTFEWNNSDTYTVTLNTTIPAQVEVLIYDDKHYELSTVALARPFPTMTGTEMIIESTIEHPGWAGGCGSYSNSETIPKTTPVTGKWAVLTSSWDASNAPGQTGTLNPNMVTLFFGTPPVSTSESWIGGGVGPGIDVPVTTTKQWYFGK